MSSLRLSRVPSLAFAIVLIVALVTYAVPIEVEAAKLNNRSIHVHDPKPSAVTTHDFGFDFVTAVSTGSIVFEYCQNDPLFENTCIAPAGLDVSAATIDSQAGETGFTLDAATTTNKLVLTRTPSVPVPGAASYSFGNITNPSTNNSAQYVRLSTHASTDGSGARIDDGGLAFRILTGINTEAYVPPFLLFCTGVAVEVDCDSTSGFYVNLGELSPVQASAGSSQYSGATNDESGFSVSLFGTTLTAGNQTIPALGVPTGSNPGSSQFGVNLRSNTLPTSGAEPAGAGSSAPTANYGTQNLYMFQSGQVISSSNLPTEFNRFTVTYLVNVADSQPPGVYSATFTFVAVASF